MSATDRSVPASAYIPISSGEFRAVIGATLFIMLGFGLIIPALPQFATQLGVGNAGLSFILSAFAFTRLVGNFFTSQLIARFGERVMAGVGAAIVGLSSLAAGMAHSYVELLVFRGLGGFGSAFFLGAITAYLVGTVSPEERGRAMSLFQGSVGVGLLLGPVVGGLVIAAARVNTPLYVYGAVCLLFVPLALRVMREHRGIALSPDSPELLEPTAIPARPSWKRVRPLLRHSAFRAALGANAVSFIAVSAPQTLIVGYWTGTLHLSKASSGLPFFIEGFASMVIIWHAGAVSDRRGRKFVLVPAMAASVGAALVLGLFGGTVALVIGMTWLGLANGYTRPGPTAIVADVAAGEDRAIAVSAFRIAGDIGALVGPVLAGVLSKYFGYGAAWIGVGACMFAVFIMMVVSEETAPLPV